MCSHPTISYSPDYKTFKFNAKNEGMKEGKAADKSCLVELDVSDVRSEDCGVILNPPPDEKGNGNVARRALETTQDKINGNHKAANDSEDSTRRNSHFTRKESMDYELPELVVFLQESSYHFVKDMCIDKKLPCKEKSFVENCELEHKIISCVLESDADRKSKPLEQAMKPLSSSITKESKPTDEDDHGDKGTKQHGFTNLVTEGLDSSPSDGISIHKAIKEIVPELQLVVQKVQKSALTSPPTVDNNKDTSQTSSVTIPKEVKSGRNSCDSDFSVATIIGAEEPSLGADCHQEPAETEHTTTSHENEISESFTEPSPVHQQYCNEEPTHLAGLMSHHVSASTSFRSISLRSSSSATSSRSFAFPILAAEWNGSPEKMVKPEKRQLKKRRGKCFSFLCCKF
ncbi:uncharacterized protein LOC133830785 isoform X2 [Humulus lupulus]|nr:uncharacterized protein LOC133830785 isoform X2 [Humulus lupulus]XP_062116843.1 uncharacterized protein LOC133830785 isoform X2 [Humulus lupulus]